ncbi:putative major intrinsic protein [Rosa chinensis]|uniref:Putative major intrinsic protein n=1 Tax=Rosa chinensis TaxID=74649 RepID=A0A2P6PHJ8_ROSCH|nr:putative major intrinsic protein [Rosa chinensis]
MGIAMLGRVSSCHLNPAASIALAADRKFPYKHMTAATLASSTLRLLFQDNINVTVTLYSDSTTHLQALVWEFIATFILMFTICGVATDHKATIQKEICEDSTVGSSYNFVRMILKTIWDDPTVGSSYNCVKMIQKVIHEDPTVGSSYNFVRMILRAIRDNPTVGSSYNFERMNLRAIREELTVGSSYKSLLFSGRLLLLHCIVFFGSEPVKSDPNDKTLPPVWSSVRDFFLF